MARYRRAREELLGWPRHEARKAAGGAMFSLLPLHQQLGLVAVTAHVAVTDYVSGFKASKEEWLNNHLHRVKVSVSAIGGGLS